MSLDRIRLQIFADHARAVIEQVALTLQRTAYSAFVKEMKDFTAGLVTPNGETFVASHNSSWFMGLDYKALIDLIEDYEEGDLCITSDPYSGFVCTHSPDTHIWMPIFYEGELVCFVVSHVHNTDVGGAVPASLSRTLTEIHQEGIRLPPTKLLRRGQLNQELLDVFLLNVRAPIQNWGDMKAQIAAMNTGAVQILNVINRFGVDDFRGGIRGLLDYSEEQTRLVIRSIPNGEYYFHDYIDEDSEGGPPCRFAVNMIVGDDTITLDFRKSDPQLASSINVPTGGHERHTLLLVCLYHVLSTLRPGMLINTGATRPVRCLLTEGSVLHPTFPAAVGMRSASTIRLVDVLLGAFVQALPALPAASGGTVVVINARAFDQRSGRDVMAAVNPMIGGSGATPDSDGQNGSGGTASPLRNTPVEINEIEAPIRIRRYQINKDSGGAGRHRGGLGIVFEFEVQSPRTIITARNRDRTKFSSWGIYGGKSGGPSTFERFGRKGDVQKLDNTDVVVANPGDIIRMTSPGGGGYGSPFDRPVTKVEADIACGFVSREAAASEYGLVFRGNKVDHAATEVERAKARRQASDDVFQFGVNRYRFENVWPREHYDALIDFLMSMPVQWRFYLKHRVFDEVNDRKIDLRDLNKILSNLHKDFPELAATSTS